MMAARITIARRADMEEVYRLTYEAYLEERYIDVLPERRLNHYPALDLVPETTVYLARDERGQLLGTVSSTLDGPAGLHTDQDFPAETDAVRREAWVLGDAWRVITSPACRRRLDVVMFLFDACLRDMLEVMETTLYTFNPKHEPFYARFFGLRTIAGPRSSRWSIHGAPAILMRGEPADMLRIWEARMGPRLSRLSHLGAA